MGQDDRNHTKRNPSAEPEGPLAWLQQGKQSVENELGGRLADARITASIQSALLTIQPATGLSVDVDTAEGVVYLRGEVASEAQKAEAERIAREVSPPDVRQIVNELRVNPEMPYLPHP